MFFSTAGLGNNGYTPKQMGRFIGRPKTEDA